MRKEPKYEIMDIDTWKRNDTFNFYRNFDDPYFQICAEIELSELYQQCKEKGYSFFLAYLHKAITMANRVENFRYRWKGDGVIKYESLFPGSTILYDDNTFGFCYFEYHRELEEFDKYGKLAISKQKSSRNFESQSPHNNIIYFTTIPWVRLSSFKHARNSGGDTSIPKIVFGKYTVENSRVSLPLSVEVNHALVDGYHVGQFFQYMDESVNNQI